MKSTTINPYLRFNDTKCKEAMNFYKSIFGGKLEIQTVGQTPMKGEMPGDKQDLVMHAELVVNDKFTLYASDMMRDKAVIGDNVSVAIQCTSQNEIETFFKKLSEGGDVFMPLEDTFWGAVYGMVTDKYGIEWQLNFQKTPIPKK